jgi:hypothetical protein
MFYFYLGEGSISRTIFSLRALKMEYGCLRKGIILAKKKLI